MKQNNMNEEEFHQSLKKEGLTYDDFRKDVERQIIQIKFIKKVIEPRVEINETDAKNYYTQNKEELVKEERVRLSQILILVPEGASASDWKTAENKIQEVSKKVKEGLSFEKLAEDYSQGPGASSGGDLGYFVLVALAPELKNAVAGLSKDQTSEPIKSDIGWQIIKYTDRISTASQSFEELKDVIVQQLREKQVMVEYHQYFMNLRQKSDVDVRI